MNQLLKLKRQLENPSNEDEILEYCLDRAKNIICELRNSDKVEPQYLSTQIAIAVEIYNKRGAEGQISHGENGISRGYEESNISKSLLAEITPIIKTPFSKVRVIE